MSDQPDPRKLVQQQFGAHAQGYVSSPVHSAGYSLHRLVELVQPGPGTHALDLATGGGHTALAMTRAGADTVAGDLTRPMLQAARSHITAQGAAVRYVQLDAGCLPFPAESFDLVTCRVAPHHFPQVAEFVSECARVVRPGGTVAVIDQLTPGDPQAARYVNAFERLRDPSHVWAYSREDWLGFFSAAGLDVGHYEQFDTDHELTEWAERMGCDAPTTLRLRAMLQHAPEPAAAWMKPQLPSTADARFVIQQFLIVSHRPDRV